MKYWSKSRLRELFSYLIQNKSVCRYYVTASVIKSSINKFNVETYVYVYSAVFHQSFSSLCKGRGVWIRGEQEAKEGKKKWPDAGEAHVRKRCSRVERVGVEIQAVIQKKERQKLDEKGRKERERERGLVQARAELENAGATLKMETVPRVPPPSDSCECGQISPRAFTTSSTDRPNFPESWTLILSFARFLFFFSHSEAI